MYGIYAWQAGATGPQVVADLVALICGAGVAALSAVCDKPASSVAGGASGWSVVDAPYGVIGAPSQDGGPARVARLMASDVPRLLLASVHGWSMATHLPAAATNAMECSGVIADAGSINLVATPAGLLLAASDWSIWALLAECKRGAPGLVGGASGSVVINNSAYAYVARAKNPDAIGQVDNAAASIVSSYGGLSARAARDSAEQLYTPMVPACVAVKQTPFGELLNVRAVGGYGQSGDIVTDAGAVPWVIARMNAGLGLSVARK